MANPSDEPPYRELVEKAPIGIFEVNQAGEYVNVNKSACELVGYTENELLELSVSDLIQTGDEPHEVPSFTELSETGHMRYAGKILHKDGSEVDVILDAVALENRGYVAYVQNNTAQKEYERELQDAKIRFQSLFEKAPEGIVIHDSNGDILEVNQQEIENLGYSRADLRSMNIADIEAGLSQEESQALWDQMDVGDTHKVETELERNDDSTYPVEVWANKIDIHGDVRFLAFARDIAERKEREQQLRREKERLDEFASVISHDLRNPLNVAQGGIDLAQEHYDSEHLDDAAYGVQRCLDLIEDLLALARGGQEIGDMEPVAVTDLVRTCWNTVETADAEVVADLESSIQADRSRFRQLFENIFRNAVEHGGEDVTIRIGSLQDGFYVEDNGPGIPENERADVFETGYSKNPNGKGFGLSIVQTIVEAHGWDIRLTESSEGGARFEFTGVEFAAD